MVLLAVVTLILTCIGYPLIKKILLSHNLVTENFSGNEVPVGYGLLLVINIIIILIIGRQFGIYSKEVTTSFLFLTIVVGATGLIDDYLGDEKSSGFSGHLRKLWREYSITTGFLKASLIGIFTFLIVNRVIIDNFTVKIINFLLVVLMTNFINLLDLQPGRALKGFIIITFISLAITDILFIKLVLPFLLMVGILLPVDLHAEAMLGDVGSNLLGGFLGLALLFSLGLIYKLILVIGLVVIHFYTENASLTNLIAHNRILNYIDQLGR
ncbi:glycosyl transferase family 4 [Sporohalobacter salinus]|uniref:glycosyl transferase family 4 n=1 Tax=Sporohalobacter salinus TaxID=1494606 RepID=UPI0019614A4C|nr:glycosyl transferase family 4 [Sporohalobacter salinus]MBM7622778.1 UDP-N-acetylmuramyl pentapeptide phosphotransferase/UDP-N-acetylglucosamine-1-phosphate transferase [Sporohalobacter salinus]